MSLKSNKKANYALTLSIIGNTFQQTTTFVNQFLNFFSSLNVFLTGLVLIFVVNFYTGLTLFAHYRDCNPFKSGQIGAKDELLPFYIMDVFHHIPFVNGIFVAGIFAASLG